MQRSNVKSNDKETKNWVHKKPEELSSRWNEEKSQADDDKFEEVLRGLDEPFKDKVHE